MEECFGGEGLPVSHILSDAAKPLPMAGTTTRTGLEEAHLPHTPPAPPFQEFCIGQEPAPDLTTPSFDGVGCLKAIPFAEQY